MTPPKRNYRTNPPSRSTRLRMKKRLQEQITDLKFLYSDDEKDNFEKNRSSDSICQDIKKEDNSEKASQSPCSMCAQLTKKIEFLNTEKEKYKNKWLQAKAIKQEKKSITKDEVQKTDIGDGVLIDTLALNVCKLSRNQPNTFARMLIRKIFEDVDLKKFSLNAKPCNGNKHLNLPVLPALDARKVNAIVNYTLAECNLSDKIDRSGIKISICGMLREIRRGKRVIPPPPPKVTAINTSK